MNIHRKMCISLSVIFFLSIIAFYIVRSAHPTVSNILIAILTGAFLAIYTALVNYLHEREEFFNNLFLTGLFINSNFEQIKQLIANLSENSNLRYASKAIQNYANTINNITMNINFAQYTPFYNNSKEARMVERIQAIYHLTQKLIVLTSNNMEISNLEAEILVSKLNSKIPPCVSCIIPTEQRTSHAQCNAYIEYQKTINELTDKLKQQNIKTINLINTIYQNTISLQTEHLDIMKCLHCRTKNKTNWEEIIKTNKENITKTMQNYIEDTINK